MASPEPTDPNLPLVRVEFFIDILNAYKKYGENFQSQFIMNSETPSLCSVMQEAHKNGKDVAQAKRDFYKDYEKSPPDHQPAISGFCIRIEKRFGKVTHETLAMARATLIEESGYHLMPRNVNRMTLRQFNREWDTYVTLLDCSFPMKPSGRRSGVRIDNKRATRTDKLIHEWEVEVVRIAGSGGAKKAWTTHKKSLEVAGVKSKSEFTAIYDRHRKKVFSER